MKNRPRVNTTRAISVLIVGCQLPAAAAIVVAARAALAMVSAPELIPSLHRRPVAIPGSLDTSLVPEIVAYITAVEVRSTAAPESQEEPTARVPRSHPISACIGRPGPI